MAIFKDSVYSDRDLPLLSTYADGGCNQWWGTLDSSRTPI